MPKLIDRAWMSVATAPGTGPVLLGDAYSDAYCTFAEAGAVNGDQLPYVLEDDNNFEIGIGTYSGTSVTRDTISLSKIGGMAGTSKIDAGASATIFILPRSSEFSSLAVSVKAFGAKGDGTTDDTAAIRAAIDAVGTAGGGMVYLPAGEFLVSNPDTPAASWDDDVALWVLHDNVHIVGAGRGATIIKLADNADCHVLKLGQRVGDTIAVTDVSIRDLTIDGNRANQTAPTDSDDHWSGIDVATGGKRIELRGLHVHDCQYYGIGLQRGAFIDCVLDDICIERCGADGIDIKNDDNLNYGNKVTRITVREFGLASLTLDQAGLDIYGGVHASHITVTDFGPEKGKNGIRFLSFNAGFAQSTNPELFGFYIEGDGSADTIGVRLGAREGLACNGHVKNCATGVRIDQRENKLSNVLADTCGNGFLLTSTGSPTNADRNVLHGCTARACTGHGFSIDASQNENILIGCVARSNATGVNVGAGATDNQIIGCALTSNTANLVDGGTSTTRVFNKGAGLNNFPEFFTVLARSAVQVTAPADTSENTLATITVPAGFMGNNGVWRLRAIFACTNNANAKTVRVRFGGTNFVQQNLASAVSGKVYAAVANRNATNSQVLADHQGTVGMTVVTGSIDTTSNQNITITIEKADASDTVTLENYSVELLRT